MRALVVMAVLGACVAAPFIPDDPAVAAEKARFFKTFRFIEAANRPRSSMPIYQSQQAAFIPAPRPQPKWTGPLASDIPAGLPGSTAFVGETSDVNAARNAFFNAYKAQVIATVPTGPTRQTYSSQSAYAPAPRPQPKWTGPLASQVPASLPGASPIVADTPEVNAAKAAFYNTYRSQVKATMPLLY
ncbi:hypothetical protein Pmani_011091 [Petrolisthes manimaculis]|uniref:Calcified cuticle protein CP19.0 n=1 Tax=Petrolisthes manimaculis TaxID=1843537 RepID=A0AAE1UBX6_9EUCA|nr:hypothetical protein Pmani_011091 [Petrolisthes manimaculis]